MEARSFYTTRWSTVLAAADRSSPESAEALATLCRVYWYPLYAFVRRRGYSAHEAEDLTQEFFARLLEKDYLKGIGPEKGRFRSFLLVCMRRFLANEWDRSRAKKRDSGRAMISIDLREAENRYCGEPADCMTGERIFERRWALALLEQAIGRLEDEFRRSKKTRLFERLKVYLVAEHRAPPYAQVAEELGMSEGAVKVAVHRLRQRFRRTVRAEVARTLDDPNDVDDEIRRLFEVLKM